MVMINLKLILIASLAAAYFPSAMFYRQIDERNIAHYRYKRFPNHPYCPGYNEVYTKCDAKCESKCFIIPDVVKRMKCVNTDCIPGCICSTGSSRNSDGICVPNDVCRQVDMMEKIDMKQHPDAFLRMKGESDDDYPQKEMESYEDEDYQKEFDYIGDMEVLSPGQLMRVARSRSHGK